MPIFGEKTTRDRPYSGATIELVAREFENRIMRDVVRREIETTLEVKIERQLNDATRLHEYRSDLSRKSFNCHYDTWNLNEHFTVEGHLFARQGASWPVDVIVIEGRGRSSKALPMAEAPVVYSEWAQMKDRLDGQASLDPRGKRPVSGDGSDPTEPNADPSGLQGRPVQSDSVDNQGVGPGGKPAVTAGSPVAGGKADTQNAGGNTGSDGRQQRPADGGLRDQRSGVADDAGTTQGGSEPGLDAGTSGGRDDPSKLADDGVSGRAGLNGKPRENAEVETSLQVQYQPTSGAVFAVGTVMPRNMQEAITAALVRLHGHVVDMDNFVAF